MLPGPTFATELRRGLNAYNLKVGAVTALGLGFLLWGGLATGFLPAALFHAPPALAAGLGAVLLFVSITVLHAGAHAYMGWHLARGIAASRTGRSQEAVRWLTIVSHRGMDHYDIDGVARSCLADARSLSE